MKRALITVCLAWIAAHGASAQEALSRPAWVQKPDYALVYPKHFGAEDVANMLVELPNRPRRVGQKGSLGPEFMFPRRPQQTQAAAVQGPELFRPTPFGPVASTLQRPAHADGTRPMRRPSRRKPLGW